MVTPADNPYAPPKSTVSDVAAMDGDNELASRGSRLGAKLLDALVVGVPFIPSYIRALPALLSHAKAAGQTKVANTAIWSALAGTGGWFYFALLVLMCTMTYTAVLVHRNGQTIGKKALGIKIVRKDGARATLGRIFWLRYLANTLLTLIPGLGPIYGLIDVLFIFGGSQRCCHDYIADTVVVKA